MEAKEIVDAEYQKERLFAFVPGVARKTATVEETLRCYVPKIVPIENVPLTFFQTQLEQISGEENLVVVKESQLLNTKTRRQAEIIKESDSVTFSTQTPAFFQVRLKPGKTLCQNESKTYARVAAHEVDLTSESIVVLHGFARRV